MKIGIIPNIHKKNIFDVVVRLVKKIDEAGLQYILSDSLVSLTELPEKFKESNKFFDIKTLFAGSDFVISIGGDGTMLSTAIEAKYFDTPMIGLNFGKLGFLAEFDIQDIDELITDLKQGNYIIEERMALEAKCLSGDEQELFAINDIVIDKGGWPKMIQLSMRVDDDYVTTFSADGIIIATPTGTTGYSLSTGGPIVSPKTNAITLSPISPHTLTMRPLVLDSSHKILITVESQHTTVQINCDGQRVYYYKPPVTIVINKSARSIKLVHTKSTHYFEILRKKLYWGLDIRNNPNNRGEKIR